MRWFGYDENDMSKVLLPKCNVCYESALFVVGTPYKWTDAQIIGVVSDIKWEFVCEEHLQSSLRSREKKEGWSPQNLHILKLVPTPLKSLDDIEELKARAKALLTQESEAE